MLAVANNAPTANSSVALIALLCIIFAFGRKFIDWSGSLFLAPRVVLALGTGGAIGSLGDAHAILGLGLAAARCARGGNAVGILLRHRGVARIRVVGGFGTVAVLY